MEVPELVKVRDEGMPEDYESVKRMDRAILEYLEEGQLL